MVEEPYINKAKLALQGLLCPSLLREQGEAEQAYLCLATNTCRDTDCSASL